MNESEFFEKVCKELGLTSEREREVAKRVIGIPRRDLDHGSLPILRTPHDKKRMWYSIDAIAAIHRHCQAFGVEGFETTLLLEGLSVDGALQRLKDLDNIVKEQQQTGRSGRVARSVR
jgi:hypothetical protein